jgi:hypothetical protein
MYKKELHNKNYKAPENICAGAYFLIFHRIHRQDAFLVLAVISFKIKLIMQGMINKRQ